MLMLLLALFPCGYSKQAAGCALEVKPVDLVKMWKRRRAMARAREAERRRRR
jgi:hypothetical protein